MKIALVHDWTIHMRGGEKVLDALAELFPKATLYTLFCNKKRVSENIRNLKIETSFLQWFPWVRYYYRWLLPLMPFAIQALTIKDADIVISSSHCVAKGIKIPTNAKHFCYCHTPMRYLWGFQDIYFEKYPLILRKMINWFLSFLRKWDLRNNSQVDYFIANSKFISERIERAYRRESRVIYPPLDIERFQPCEFVSDYYLVVSHFVPYKKLDIVIKAFNELDRKLFVVGKGPLEAQYKKLRKSDTITFLGSLSDTELCKMYSGAKALIFPTEEDFGIVPLEAQACNTPVIALKRGGALESVKTGVFFDEQTPEAVREAVMRFESKEIDRSKIRSAVEPFSRSEFKRLMLSFVRDKV